MRTVTEGELLVWRGERVDANRNCFRWYHVWVQPDLFRVWVVWTAWGRIGTVRYRQRLYPTGGREEAEQLARQIIHRKFQRGYQTIVRIPNAEHRTAHGAHDPGPQYD